ncbi:flagellar export protein FliJ [Paenibacillus thermotolerans]|uniref:flagellar export protein FliJ n=1 Tax=Paenibacillus thermotolerans TaxID=3027807 RepID=UPI002367A0EC|nr:MULTISPECIES: flagellar export protein FliJ [unclassified Paenibacillus]
MRFAYPLQKIVDLKANEKKQAESSLSQAISFLNEEERKRDELSQAKLSLQEQLTGENAEKLAVSEMMLIQQYIDHLDDQIRKTGMSIVQAERAVESRRQQLTERMVDEKVWVKAREKAHSAHKERVEKQSQNQLDDLALARRRNA